jgi:hypothetical protein
MILSNQTNADGSVTESNSLSLNGGKFENLAGNASILTNNALTDNERGK